MSALVAVLGAPNAGKTTLVAQLDGSLVFPLHWLRIACHRTDRARLWAEDWHELLAPDDFTVRAGQLPKGDRHLVERLCDAQTALQQPEPDLRLTRHIVSVFRARWTRTGRTIFAEGELLSKREWLHALDPDRVWFLGVARREGVVRRIHKNRPHPSLDWTPEAYHRRQVETADLVRAWLDGEEGGAS